MLTYLGFHHKNVTEPNQMDTQEFLDTHAPDGGLTPQQAANLLEMVQQQQGEPSPPSPVIAEDASLQGQQAQTQAPAPIATYTPIDKSAARADERHWKSQAQMMAAELAAMQGAATRRATEAAPIQQSPAIEIDPEIFGDFSEVAIAKGVQQMVQAGVKAGMAQEIASLRGELAQVVNPLLAKGRDETVRTHYDTIRAAHPDADAIAESQELARWIDAQPSFAREGYRAALVNGTTEQIIEFFDNFKLASGVVATPTASNARASALAAAASAPQATPYSLSDIPGGRFSAGNWMDTLASKSAPDMAEAMQNMTPDQIESFLSRQ